MMVSNVGINRHHIPFLFGIFVLSLYQSGRISVSTTRAVNKEEFVQFPGVDSRLLRDDDDGRISGSANTTSNYINSRLNNSRQGFGACVLARDDNDKLREWIAYHYTVLPLRNILVAVDDGSTDDPRDVLKRWQYAGVHDLTYNVVNVSEFVDLHSHFEKQNKEESHPKLQFKIAHDHLLHKQRAFVTYCSRYMRSLEVTPKWTSFWDSDEFVVINRISQDEREKDHTDGPNSLLSNENRYGKERSTLPDSESNSTVFDIIESWTDLNTTFKSCHCLPRVTFGAIETFQCPQSSHVKTIAEQNGISTTELNTIRFHQHARENDFEKNKWGKVMMDLRRIPSTTLDGQEPKNIHRPYTLECPKPLISVKMAPFVLMHHTGSFARYTRNDGDKRRSYKTWTDRAFVSASTSFCSQHVPKWLLRFMDIVGREKARYILSPKDEPKFDTTHPSSLIA